MARGPCDGLGRICGRSRIRSWGIEDRRHSEILHARRYDRLARLNIFHLPLHFFVRLFLCAVDRFLALLLLFRNVMTISAFAAGLRAHGAAGEIKQDRRGEQKEQGFLKHAAFKAEGVRGVATGRWPGEFVSDKNRPEGGGYNKPRTQLIARR